MSKNDTIDHNYTRSVNNPLLKVKKGWVRASKKYEESLKDFEQIHKYIYFLISEEGYTETQIADLVGVKRQRIHTITKNIETHLGGDTT